MPLAKVAPLALRASARLFRGGVERRVAQGYVKGIVGFNHPPQDVLEIILLPEIDVQFVERGNLPRRIESDRVYIYAREVPAVLTLAGKRVNQASSSADVQRLYATPTGDFLIVATGEQVSQIVDIIDATGDRRAQIIRRDVPKINIVMRLEQCAVQHADRQRVLEINGHLPDRVAGREYLKFW